MTLPHGEEITEHFGTHWLHLAGQLPPHQQRVLNGPRTEQQRLIELQLVLDSAILMGCDRFLQCGERGITVVKEDGSRFWFVAFADVDAALPGLPADAHETLDMARQVYDPASEAVVALLMPERRVRLLYVSRDGIRGQIYQRAAVSIPSPAQSPAERAADRPAPERVSRGRARPGGREGPPPTKIGGPGLIGEATVTANGYLIRVAHPERGLIGKVTLTQIDPEHMRVDAAVTGHEDDPTTSERQALLMSVVTALEQGFAAVRHDRAAARSVIASVLIRGVVAPDVPRRIGSQALPCERCGQPAFFLVFAEEDALTLDDYGRMMFELARGYGVPAWVVRAGPEGFVRAEARQFYPTRGDVVLMTSEELDDLIEATFAAHGCS